MQKSNEDIVKAPLDDTPPKPVDQDPRAHVLKGALNTQAALIDELREKDNAEVERLREVVRLSPEYKVTVNMVTHDKERKNYLNATCTVNGEQVEVKGVHWNDSDPNRSARRKVLSEAAIRQYQKLHRIIE